MYDYCGTGHASFSVFVFVRQSFSKTFMEMGHDARPAPAIQCCVSASTEYQLKQKFKKHINLNTKEMQHLHPHFLVYDFHKHIILATV